MASDLWDEPDNPDTEYECPVCKQPIKLIQVFSHIQSHRDRGDVREYHEGWIAGLLYVAVGVVSGIKPKPLWLKLALENYNRTRKDWNAGKPVRIRIIQGGGVGTGKRK